MTISTPTLARLQECLSTPAYVLATAVGPMQYAERGHGPAVLTVHGTPGGYDQGLVGLGFASSAQRLIAPSRPGYLGTPLSTGRTPDQQADARPRCSTPWVSTRSRSWEHPAVARRPTCWQPGTRSESAAWCRSTRSA